MSSKTVRFQSLSQGWTYSKSQFFHDGSYHSPLFPTGQEQNEELQSEICAAPGISRATLYRYVKEATSPVSDS